MVYVLTALGLPTLACMLHAKTQDDNESFRGGIAFLGIVVVLALLSLPFLGVD